MRPALFDTAIYISALRRTSPVVVEMERVAAEAPLWLSSVVLEELYAGARERDRPVVQKLETHFTKTSRVLVPNLSDWVGAGKVLARIAEKYGHEEIGRGRLTNDALIAVSAGRLEVRVFTSNVRDFQRLAEFTPFEYHAITA